MKTFNWGLVGAVMFCAGFWIGIVYLVRWILMVIFRNLAG